ncbi:MAG: M23 family metallopeptidase, partial [Akkermansiaceae bacterium]|nr:M23 family metallopeptidase [Akkermansiaceae bacterium]
MIRPNPSPMWLALLALLGAGDGGIAAPGTPLRHKPLAEKFLPGESHVPGFPATPAKLTPGYIAAFMAAEVSDPSEQRMLHAFDHPDMGLPLVTFLPRYRSPRLILPLRKLARAAPRPAVQAGAIAGLIGALDDTPETRLLLRGLLRSPHAVVRDRAAEYCRWFGTREDLPFLNRQGAAERDLHARAAMAEAVAAISRRSKLFTEGPSVLKAVEGGPAEVYRGCADALAPGATCATRASAITRIRGAEVFEPIHRFGDRAHDPARGDALLAAHRLLAGYPETPVTREGPAAPPAATAIVPPVRNYADPSRESYGILIKPELQSPFTGKYHVGDDCAWQLDHETVVAIADGIVRQVDLGLRSWGGLVVIEHRDRRGEPFCSLYGHLGPLVCVQPGDAIKAGRKI